MEVVRRVNHRQWGIHMNKVLEWRKKLKVNSDIGLPDIITDAV